MDKPADTQYPIHDLFRRRWSPRAFSNRPVEDETLLSVLEAARWAPSSFNEQPWRFLMASQENSDEFERMLGCLMEVNQAWAQAAPVMMISMAKTYFGDDPAKTNRHAFHDVGLATSQLVLQALDHGLYVHQMAGFDPSKTREVYAIPEGFEPVAGIALGYPGKPEDLPAKLAERERKPRTRMALSELVFDKRWGETSRLVG
ncbi:MAG: nitroreductase family protein [Candidatus Bipolaricaulia bacterium]